MSGQRGVILHDGQCPFKAHGWIPPRPAAATLPAAICLFRCEESLAPGEAAEGEIRGRSTTVTRAGCPHGFCRERRPPRGGASTGPARYREDKRRRLARRRPPATFE